MEMHVATERHGSQAMHRSVRWRCRRQRTLCGTDYRGLFQLVRHPADALQPKGSSRSMQLSCTKLHENR